MTRTVCCDLSSPQGLTEGVAESGSALPAKKLCVTYRDALSALKIRVRHKPSLRVRSRMLINHWSGTRTDRAHKRKTMAMTSRRIEAAHTWIALKYWQRSMYSQNARRIQLSLATSINLWLLPVTVRHRIHGQLIIKLQAMKDRRQAV